jgi:2-keto-3-deoxygluconate permease
VTPSATRVARPPAIAAARPRRPVAPGRIPGLIPGLAVLVPLVAGALVATLVPHAAGIGPFTAAVLSRPAALGEVAAMLCCVGAQITPAGLRPVAGRLALILATATVLPGVAALGYGAVFGPAGIGGVSLLAVAVAATCTSNAMWLALTARYGTPADQWAGTVAAAVNSGPAVPLALLSIAGHTGTGVPWSGLLDAIAPLAAGFAAGTARPAWRAPMRAAIPVLLVAFTFALGAQLDLRAAATALPAGTALGLTTALLAGALTATGYLLLREPATVGWAAAARTVGAPIVPGIIATDLPGCAPYAATATAQVAIAVLISSLAAPALTAVTGHRIPPVGVAGFEPTAPRSQSECATKLRHTP